MIIIGDQVAPIFVGIQISLQLSWDLWGRPLEDKPTNQRWIGCAKIDIWISLCCYMDLSTMVGPVGRPLQNVYFVKYIFPRNRTSSNFNLKNNILLKMYLSQLVRVRGKYTFLSFSDFQTLDPWFPPKYVTVSTTQYATICHCIHYLIHIKYVTVSNTWARKDTVTSYLTKYTLCTGSETKGGGRFFEAPLKMMIRKDSVVGWEGGQSPPPPSKSLESAIALQNICTS